MPNRDGTGPNGEGPRTGRGFGPCSRGLRPGFGRFRGPIAHGWGFSNWENYPRNNSDNKKELLEGEKRALEKEKKEIEEALKEVDRELKNATE